MTDRNDDTDTEQHDDKPAPSSKWYNNRGSLRYRTVSYLSKITSGRIRSPYLRSTEAYYKSKDASENAECRPSAEQRFETWGIWAVEAYTPATISRLIAGLEGLKPKARGEDRDPAQWVRRQRNNPGSSFELYIRPPKSRSLSMGFELELPDFAASGSGSIWSATPSLTILTMFFIPTDQERTRIENILRDDHPTRLVPHGESGAGIFSPELERRRVISEARSDWSAQASRWFAKNFQGLFSADAKGVPTCEATVAEGLTPFSRIRGQSADQKTLTALRWTTSSTFSPTGETENAFFYAPFTDRGMDETRYSIIAMTREAFQTQNTDGWGSDDDRFIYPLDRSFRPIIAQWAITRVLSYYRDRIANTRDMLADVVGSRRVTRAVGRVRQQTAECADAATVARDVVDSIANYSLRVYHAGLSLTKHYEDDDDRRMDVALRETLTDRGNALARDVSELNATLHAQASLLSAHANLRLQPWIIMLAIVSTFAGAVAAITPAREFLGWKNPVENTARQPKTSLRYGQSPSSNQRQSAISLERTNKTPAHQREQGRNAKP